MQLKIAICDDETIIGGELKEKILEVQSDCTVNLYQSGYDLIETVMSFDIVCLDIEMPEIDGMNLARMLREKGYKGYIIFLTSHGEFMQDAFKVRAFRFLMKPVDVNELRETLQEIDREIYFDKQVVVTDYGADFALEVSKIYYIRANGNKTIVVLEDSTIEANKTLKQWLQELGNRQFCQIHKSYLVSLEHVKKIDVDVVVLRDIDEEIPISRRSIPKVKKAFYEYIRANAKSI